MIHYRLRCAAAHEFEAWFAGSAAYEHQAEQGAIECPFCGSVQVSRALMAPALRRAGPEQPKPVPVPAAMPAALRATLQKLRADVEKHCDYVGPAFATTVRAMQDGEMDTRLVYGEATEEEARALHEDGLPVSRIPWLPKADA